MRYIIAFLILAAAAHAFVLDAGLTSQKVPFVAVDTTDLITREPGLVAGWSASYSINGGAWTGMTTPTTAENGGTGSYWLSVDEAGMTTLTAGHDVGNLYIEIAHASIWTVSLNCEVRRAKLTAGQTVAASDSKVNGVKLADTTTTNTDMLTAAAVEAEVIDGIQSAMGVGIATVTTGADTLNVKVSAIDHNGRYYSLNATNVFTGGTLLGCSQNNSGQVRRITASSYAAGVWTFTVDAALPQTPANTDIVLLIPGYINSKSGYDLSAGGVTAVQSGLALASALATVDGIVDTIAIDVAGLDGAAMRGTDNAALASAWTSTRAGYIDYLANATYGLSAIRTRGDAAWITGSTSYALNTTVATAGSTTSFTLTAGKASADAYNEMLISVTDADDSNMEVRRILDYTAGRVVTVDTAFSFTPAAGDVVHILETSYMGPRLGPWIW